MIDTRGIIFPPTTEDRRSWERRFTFLVQDKLASRDNGLLTPAHAGELAKEQVSGEWSELFPQQSVPEWMT